MNRISKDELAKIAAIIGAIASIFGSLKALISVNPLFGWIALACVVVGLLWYLVQGQRSVWIISLLIVLALVSLGAAWWVGPVTVDIAIYIDENRNGIHEAFEQKGPAGMEVQLRDSEGVMRVAYTDDGGVATFHGVPQGPYGILRVGPGGIGGNATRTNKTAQVAILPTLQPPTDTPTPTPTAILKNTPTLTPMPTATPTHTPTLTPTLAPDAIVVAPVNLRSGPGTVYDIIGTLSPGQVLTVTGRIADTTWLQVNTDQMQRGWVANRADFVTLNLPTEQIPIVSPLPPPTTMSFQNFEADNGTPGDYCRDVWFATCSFESTIVHEGSRAVRVDAHAEAEGNPGDHGGTMGINPSSSDPIDLSSATTLSVWVYDTLGNNTVQLRLRDNKDALSNAIWSEMHAEQNNWTEITWSLSDFSGVDLSQIKNIELYEWWDGVYYFDAVSWQIAMPVPAPTCLITEPADGDENLGHENEVRVACSNVPDSQYIWILVYSHRDSNYYPQPGPIGSGSGQRRGVAYLGWPTAGIGDEFDIIVALANETVSVKLRQDAESYSGYEFALPDGVEEKARITVRRGSTPVALITFHGRYVTAMGADRDWVLRAETTELKDWEKFTLLCLDDGKVALETHHGRYVTAMDDEDNRDWVLRAETTELWDWEEFTLVEPETEKKLPCLEAFKLFGQGSIRIALETHHGRYVTAMNDEDNRDWVLRAETRTLSDWEKFELVLLSE